MKLTRESAQALCNLRNNPDFQVFLVWLKEDEEAHVKTCRQNPDHAKVLKAQGAAGVYEELAKAIHDAPSVRDKFQSR